MQRPLLIFCFLVALSACRPNFERPVSAAVLSFRGAASIAVAGQQPQLVTIASRIDPGATLSTAPGARVDLMLLPGVLVELNGASELELSALRFAKDGDDLSAETTRRRTARLSLPRGSLDVFLVPSRNRKVDEWLEVESAGQNFHAEKGTIFRVQTQPDQVRMSCAQGAVDASGGGVTATIPAGESKTWLTAGAHPAAPPAPAIAPEELSQILLAASHLQQLQLHLRNTVPPWR